MIDLYMKIKDETLIGLHSYMQGCLESGTDPGYDEQSIKLCEKILVDYVFAISNVESGDTGSVHDAVMEAVLALNRLNAHCDCTLLDADPREEVLSFINRVASDHGVGDGSEDLTAQWRDW